MQVDTTIKMNDVIRLAKTVYMIIIILILNL